MSLGKKKFQSWTQPPQMAVMVVLFLAGAFSFSAVLPWQIGPAGGPALELRSTSFADGGTIPRWFTCDDAGKSPSLQWAGAPVKTRSFALVVDDPDAPVDFTHWLVYNIPADAHGLSEDASSQANMPPGSVEGTNGYGRLGYAGPCPPAGQLHHYFFRLFALDTRLNLPPGATRKQLEAAISSHIIAHAQTVGLYQRSGQ